MVQNESNQLKTFIRIVSRIMAKVSLPDGKLFLRLEEVMLLQDLSPIVNVNQMEGELEAAVYRALLHSLRLNMGQKVQEIQVHGRDLSYIGPEVTKLLNRDNVRANKLLFRPNEGVWARGDIWAVTDLSVICLISNAPDGGRIQMSYRYLEAAILPDHLPSEEVHQRTLEFFSKRNPIVDDQANLNDEEFKSLHNEITRKFH